MKRLRPTLLSWIILAFVILLTTREVHAGGAAVRVRSDLDGDHISDTAITKFRGSTVRIKIQLSGRTTPVSLSASVHIEPGLELVAYDVNDDQHVDLVLTSIFSVRPIAVWLNTPSGRFEKASEWILALPLHHKGPQYRRSLPEQDEEAVLGSADPLPILSSTPNLEHTLQEYGCPALDRFSLILTRSHTANTERGPPLS